MTSAQSTIAGLVTDATGGVLPGVTVEAGSPALIEKVRVVTTDDQGRYSIADIRPGLYTVTFTLPGFSTVRREGIEVVSNASVPINAELRVGAMEETITVSGLTPVVDVQTTARRQVLNRQMVDALPTSRNPAQMAGLVPGVKMTLDSGRSGVESPMQNLYVSGHGLATKETIWLVDGMDARTSYSNGQVNNRLNEAMHQETTIQTSAVSAESSSGGFHFNMIPREGGNRFSGAMRTGYTPKSWVGDNIDQDLRDRGVVAGDKLGGLKEFNIAGGGPIKRDRLWFYTSLRYQTQQTTDADRFQASPAINRSNWWLDPPSNTPVGAINRKVVNPSLRLTAQLSPRNKLTAFYDRPFLWEIPTSANAILWTPGGALDYNGQVKWTSTVNSKLMLEGGFTVTRYDHGKQFIEELRTERGSSEWIAAAAHFDLITGRAWHATGEGAEGMDGVVGNFGPRYTRSIVMSYVTGSHNLKLGTVYKDGWYGETHDRNADLEQLYRNGVPDSVRVYNSPTRERESYSDFGAYAQDAWTLKRVTVNAGIRYDRFTSQIDELEITPGRFTQFTRFQPEVKMPKWTNVSPRFGVTYDLFGNAKTALKATWGQYLETWATGFAERYNGLGDLNEVRTWEDLNRDDIAQDNEIGPAQNINFGKTDVLNRTFDPGMERGYNREITAGVQHELLPGVALNAMWYHRDLHNLERLDNLLTTLTDYTPVNVVSPLDGSVIVAYNLNRDKLGLVQNVDYTETDSNLRRAPYNGFEVSVNGRLPGGGNVFGGWTSDRTINVTCNSRSNPNTLRDCDQSKLDMPFQNEFKLAAQQPLPFEVRASVTLVSYGGLARAINWSISRTTRYAADCKGPCTPGALVIPNLTPTSLVLNLATPGQAYYEQYTNVNLGIAREFTLGETHNLRVQLQMFNVLNRNTPVAENQTFGSSLRRPIVLQEPRVVQVGAQYRF